MTISKLWQRFLLLFCSNHQVISGKSRASHKKFIYYIDSIIKEEQTNQQNLTNILLKGLSQKDSGIISLILQLIPKYHNAAITKPKIAIQTFFTILFKALINISIGLLITAVYVIGIYSLALKVMEYLVNILIDNFESISLLIGKINGLNEHLFVYIIMSLLLGISFIFKTYMESCTGYVLEYFHPKWKYYKHSFLIYFVILNMFVNFVIINYYASNYTEAILSIVISVILYTTEFLYSEYLTDKTFISESENVKRQL